MSTESNLLSGYASVFGNKDKHGDIISQGAFQESIKINRPILLFWQHSKNEPIGEIIKCYEDTHGLKVEFKFFREIYRGKDIEFLCKGEFIFGMSFSGYVQQHKYDHNNTRMINKVALDEISIVTVPANEKAVIQFIKEK